jgi:hypothetical protein
MPIHATTRSRIELLVLALVAGLLVRAFQSIPQLFALVYPLRLFTTLVHEVSHCLATLITGGGVNKFIIRMDQSGFAESVGGIRTIILPAGYIGTAIFGSCMFYLVNRFTKSAKRLTFASGIGMCLFAIIFARPEESWMPTAHVVAICYALIAVTIGWKAPLWANRLFANTIAFTTVLEAIGGLIALIQNARWEDNNDASMFAREIIPLPPGVIAGIWLLFAVGFFVSSCYFLIRSSFSKAN